MIELKAPLTPLTLQGLTAPVATQKTLGQRVVTAVSDASDKVIVARASVTTPVAGTEKMVGRTPVIMRTADDITAQKSLNSHASKQTIKLLAQIGAQLDAVAVPLIKTMTANSNTAKEMAERQWSLLEVLRRSKGGSTGTSGLVEATALRASYAAILDSCHSLELFRWAQSAIDTGDPILADCVCRENFDRPRDQRSFSTSQFLAVLQNAEYEDAKVLLATVTQMYDQATAIYAQFSHQVGAASLARMSYRLSYSGETDEDGSVIPIRALSGGQ